MYKHLLILALSLGFSALFSDSYPAYQPTRHDPSSLFLFYDSFHRGVYLEPRFLAHIDENKVSSVLEVGSRDLRDAIELSEKYHAHVFAFECNPACIEVCRLNLERTSNVTLVEKAAWDKTEEIPFFPVIFHPEKKFDPGSSSCFLFTDEKSKSYQQDIIFVPATRLDHWMKEKDIDHFDLICMDTQGATLKILQGMGDYLIKTRYIITECEHEPIYQDECVLPELILFLEELGFELVPTPPVPCDYLFINRTLDAEL